MIPAENLRRRQSSILWEITILLVVVFIAYGLLTYFVFRGSENRLIDKSIEKLKQTEAENISSSYAYVMNMRTPALVAKGLATNLTDLIKAVASKEPADIQVDISGEIGKMVESGMLGMSKNLFIIEQWPATQEPFVFASSDVALVNKWEAPDYLNQAIQSGEPYLWMENGIPELGLEGNT